MLHYYYFVIFICTTLTTTWKATCALDCNAHIASHMWFVQHIFLSRNNILMGICQMLLLQLWFDIYIYNIWTNQTSYPTSTTTIFSFYFFKPKLYFYAVWFVGVSLISQFCWFDIRYNFYWYSEYIDIHYIVIIDKLCMINSFIFSVDFPVQTSCLNRHNYGTKSVDKALFIDWPMCYKCPYITFIPKYVHIVWISIANVTNFWLIFSHIDHLYNHFINFRSCALRFPLIQNGCAH